ncbi:kynureninase [Dacryopinax primogenitus]|uniref:Kynureninase n=1 Tax=Dacryopinax primogenitus (strain DJM 731) TaxID=1858805 RepID=M5G588_DACPD|nr:kynureninase [Dacryopinax primogenitus]EJU05421.1 kynureninase [Dacryopinax primogenitus]
MADSTDLQAQSPELLDERDSLNSFRDEFYIPQNGAVGASNDLPADQPCTYMCGNSLGLLSKLSESLVQGELRVWATRGVVGHFSHPYGREWVEFGEKLSPLLAPIVGAHSNEVISMSTLTANLHLMMNAFYKPTKERFKILCEARAFPSDRYAFHSQASAHGFDPKEAVVAMSPREGEHILREEDILDIIAKEGSSIAVICFSGVQYYTGQLFDMQRITHAGKHAGCIVGWDLAHAIGNVPLSLHDWGVDWAVWCTYKYLNSGAGGIGGLFVHSKWDNIKKPDYAGWWGQQLSTRFQMPEDFTPIPGAWGYQQSNPSCLTLASLLGSLEIFQSAGGVQATRKKSVLLTGYLDGLLRQSNFYCAPEGPSFTIITPSDPFRRGAQLSLLFSSLGTMQKVFDGLTNAGVICDERQPDVIRLSPVPLYNTFVDVKRAVDVLEAVMGSL